MGINCSRKISSKHQTIYIHNNNDNFDSKEYDKFVDAASIIYSIDSLQLLLDSNTGREAFYQFLKEEHATENLNFFEAVDSIMNPNSNNNNNNDDDNNIKKGVGSIVDKFLLPTSSEEVNLSSNTKALILSTVKAATDNQTNNYEYVQDALIKARNDILIIMTLGSYPRFVKSNKHIEWKRKLEKESLETVTRSASESTNTNASIDSSSKLSLSMESICDQEIGKLLKSGISWITNFMVATDNLPFCIAIATANKKRYGFPLIFVNKCFIKSTGYDYSDIIGQNCKFLQKKDHIIEEKEVTQRLALTESLRDAKPVKVVITNYRKNGQTFLNLLSMKPIFDQNGKYRYVVSMQFEVNDESSSNVLSMADSLADLLPSQSFCTDDDE